MFSEPIILILEGSAGPACAILGQLQLLGVGTFRNLDEFDGPRHAVNSLVRVRFDEQNNAGSTLAIAAESVWEWLFSV